MAIFASRVFAILALLAVLPVRADDDVAVSDDAPATEPAAAEGGGEAAGEEKELTEEEKKAKGEEFVDSAKELQEKLGQLRALLDAKSEGADPALKERLAGLENQLKTLGLDGLGGGGAASPELTEFLGACVAMSLRRAGMQRPATLGALKRLVQKKLPPAEAAKDELWRMVAVCITEFKEDEFQSFKAGKVKILPKSYVDESKKPEAEKKVLEIEDQVWDQLRTISAGLLEELTGNQAQVQTEGTLGYILMLPFLGVCGLMGYGFYKMNNKDETKKEKKSKKGPDSGSRKSK